MRRLVRNWRNAEEGFSLVWLALTLTVLLGMAGLAVDLGWLYLNAVRTQAAADAAALAGVVNLPGFPYTADAEAAVRANGYDPGGADTLVLEDNGLELYAQLSTDVPLFFMRVLGFRNQTITRDATAQFVRPVPLGNPDNCFGGGPGTGCSADADFWAAVNGQRTQVDNGDPFSTRCDDIQVSGTGIVCDGGNPLYARRGSYTGYYYAVEVFPTTASLTVEIYDGAFQRRMSQGTQTGDNLLAGSVTINEDGEQVGDTVYHGPPTVETTFTLYRPDDTPLVPHDHRPGDAVCPAVTSDMLAVNAWSQLCSTIPSPTEGLYLIHVEATNPSAGSNNFAIRATSTGGETPRVYGVNDLSIWSNALSDDSELYLVEIGPEHAGKKLEIQLYDAGDAIGTADSTFSVLNPHGATPPCSWTVWNHDFTAEQTGLNGSGACSWIASNPDTNEGVYNGLWIRAVIDLPDDPDDMCDAGDCWWKMDLNLDVPTDRTTWTARVIGNPVRLLP